MSRSETVSGPLAGIRILEFEGIGPGPHTAMVLAGLGANVLRISRPGSSPGRKFNPVLERGRVGRVALDLKSPQHREHLLSLMGQADALIEGFRPDVMERLGLGPDECLARNPALVYGRVTGWGRTGPLAHSAGHDINYIALTGALHAIGTPESGPIPPLNLVGDFGGGGLLLAFGMVCALLEARTSGRGQVVDAAMVDGAASLMSMIYGMLANGRWTDRPAQNILDGSAYFYTCYPCKDGGSIAVGAIEPQFRREFLAGLGFEAPFDRFFKAADDDAGIRADIARRFLERDRDEWATAFEGTDACVSPVLSMEEAAGHPHVRALGSVRKIDGVNQPAPVPTFSVTLGSLTNAGDVSAWDLGDLPLLPTDPAAGSTPV